MYIEKLKIYFIELKFSCQLAIIVGELSVYLIYEVFKHNYCMIGTGYIRCRKPHDSKYHYFIFDHKKLGFFYCNLKFMSLNFLLLVLKNGLW